MAAYRFHTALKKVQHAVIKAVQGFLLPVCLTLVYLVLLGLTWPFALLFAPRKGLGLFAGKHDTYWKKAEGYEGDMNKYAEPF